MCASKQTKTKTYCNTAINHKSRARQKWGNRSRRRQGHPPFTAGFSSRRLSVIISCFPLSSLSLCLTLSLSPSDSKTFTKNMRHPPFFLGNTRSTKKTRDPSKCRSARQGKAVRDVPVVSSGLYCTPHAMKLLSEAIPLSFVYLPKPKPDVQHTIKKNTRAIASPSPPSHPHNILLATPPPLRCMLHATAQRDADASLLSSPSARCQTAT